jgi:hypothetical protein
MIKPLNLNRKLGLTKANSTPSDTAFKVSVLWNVWTPQVATRILRDCLAIQRLARVNRSRFIIASDQEMHPMLKAMGIAVTTNLLDPSMVRAYLVKDELTAELQARLPNCEDTEVITVTPMPTAGDEHSEINIDPYAGVKLFKDWVTIPETMPLTKSPPKGPSDPMWSPFL